MARHHHCRTLSVESVSQTELNGGLSRGTSMEDTRHAGCLPSLPGPHKWVLSFASCHLNVKLCSGHAVLWSRRDQAGKRFCKNRFVCEKEFWSAHARLAYYGSAASNATDWFNSSSLSTGFLMDPMDPLNAIEQLKEDQVWYVPI